jgi:DNA topoisomerase-3
VLSQALAENVAARISGKTATVTASKRQQKKQPPPLPYNLSALQIDAAKRFSMSAKQVLDTCQNLYERHKLLTYPRSDCRYLPQDHLAECTAVMAAVASNTPSLGKAVLAADSTLKSKAWNDKKVDAHHAIIPTAKKVDADKLSPAERNIYELVARQYLAQFYPAHEYRDSQLDLEIGGGHFIARAREPLAPGWKQLFPGRKNSNTPDKPESGGGKREAALNTQLPALVKGDSCNCERGELIARQTSAPKHFDDASLLAAMTGIARYVQNPAIRKVLKDTDGLGTEATRAGIIELLFKREFLQRQGKQIRATAAGKGLVHSLPEAATRPDMTAHWETQLNAISQREASYDGFMQPLESSLNELISNSRATLPEELKGAGVSGKARRKRPTRKASKKAAQSKKRGQHQ